MMARRNKTINSANTVYQFVVLPNTGLQICRNFPIEKSAANDIDRVWQLAIKASQQFTSDEVVQLLSKNLSVNRLANDDDQTQWIRCDHNEDVFWRLTRCGSTCLMDLVVDTNRGAGKQYKNKIMCELPKRLLGFGRDGDRLSSIYVESPAAASGERGTLIIDFGNTGTTVVFSPTGKGGSRDRIVELHQPFDPKYRDRSEAELVILHSNSCFLRVPQQADADPWIVSGERARQLVLDQPLATYVFAPKKYIRHWPDHLKSLEPATQLRGVVGQRDGLVPLLAIVRMGLDHLFSLIVGRLVNPKFTSQQPEIYPVVERVMLTYPLTWRQVDRDVFMGLVSEALAKYIKHEEALLPEVAVELICSEPVAIAAYIVWESLFQYGVNAHHLIQSSLGNVTGDNVLRLLVLDIGGGSTDIAMVEVDWQIYQSNDVDVSFKMIESMRFNRAGDRLSHVIVTSLMEYVRRKFEFVESLALDDEPNDFRFTRECKRAAISALSILAETAKIHLSCNEGPWRLSPEAEQQLLDSFGQVLDVSAPRDNDAVNEHVFELSAETFEKWVRQDCQSMETNGEPGFMDVFHFLRDLMENLSSCNRSPHIIALTGRTTRLPLIRKLTVEASGLPYHWVRPLQEILPMMASRPGGENTDKLAVVLGAHRFRFGDNVRFIPLPEEKVFNRYIGSVMDTPDGLKLNNIFVRAGETSPRSIELEVYPASDVRIGHCFREEGIAEVIAVVSNPSRTTKRKAIIDLMDDFSVKINKSNGLTIAEWVPGGNDIIADNFNDTGQIDAFPRGFIARRVLQMEVNP